MSECKIEKSIFHRQVGKVYSLLEKGVKIDSEISLLKIDNLLQTKLSEKKKDNEDFQIDEDTGVEKAAKAKKPDPK